MKKITALILCFIMMMGMAASAAAPDVDDTADYLIRTVNPPTVASIGGEWTVIGLARSGFNVENSYYETYYANALNYVKSKGGMLHARKYTEYSRVILALTAIGKDPENVAGYNLVTPILDYEKTTLQGINGSIWALIALDSGNYGTEKIRNQYITHILDREKAEGGWSLSDTEEDADADVTAMALIALSNYRNRQEVEAAANRALRALSSMQNENGGYAIYNTASSESAAQVLTALSVLGISYNDPRFVKNGKNLIDNILSFRQADGSFSHIDETNLMATEQCFYALVAAKRLEEKKTSLFDMSDVERVSGVAVGLAGKNSDVNVPKINADKTFGDIAGHKNQASIEELAKRGIINGMNETVFAPDESMTRAEFATIIVRALGLPVRNTDVFQDIKPTDWYAGYIDTAYSYGIVNGISKTKFDPDGTITIEQASVMVCRAAQLCGMENRLDAVSARNVLAEFTDYMTVSDWAKPSVAFCFEQGISDRSECEIKPLEAIKRCRVADMLYHLLKGAMLI